MREKSRKLVALYVLLAVVVGIASIVGATGDHLLRTIGGVLALNCLFSAYRVVRPRPNGRLGRRIERLFVTLSGHVENDAGG